MVEVDDESYAVSYPLELWLWYTVGQMSVYLARTHTRTLDQSVTDLADDTLFVDQRFDRGELTGTRFQYCTFANVSFKNATLTECHFSGCVFEGCYFRGTTLAECQFPATRFIDCEFSKPTIYGCSFRTTRFTRSFIDFERLEPSLPGEPNLCRDLCEDLALAASALGHGRKARQYRLRAIKEREEALRRGYRWTDEYSRSHYPEFQRVTAFFKLSWSRANGLLWGHGERMSRLLLNLTLLGVGIGPGLFYWARNHLHDSHALNYGDYVGLTWASLLNNSSASNIKATGTALAIELGLTASGLLFLGLLVTYLFRAVTRR